MTEAEIKDLIHDFYWNEDLNCAATTLLTLSKAFNREISPQVLDSAIGMHGAGKYGAQCGLVEGALLFLGIYGKNENWDKKRITELCYSLAEGFEKEFSSLLCSKLRPGGFNDDDPEHLCEGLTVRAILWSIRFIKQSHS